MSRLEEFLSKNNLKYENLSVYNKSNRCFECNEIVEKGVFSEQTLEIFWICSNDHESKVKI